MPNPTHPATETAEAIAERITGIDPLMGPPYYLRYMNAGTARAIAAAIRAERASTASLIAAAREEGRRAGLREASELLAMNDGETREGLRTLLDGWAARSLADRPSHPLQESGET